MVRSYLADMEGWNGQTAGWSSYPNDEALARPATTELGMRSGLGGDKD